MFNYAISEVRAKINKLEQQMVLKQEEEQNYSNLKKDFEKCLNIRDIIYFKNTRKLIVGIMAGGIIVFPFLMPVDLIVKMIIAFLGLSLGLLVVVDSINVINLKKILKNDYFDLYQLSDTELVENIKSLKDKEFILSSEFVTLQAKKNHYNIELDKLERYKNIVSCLMGEFINSPYYFADSKEEFEKLILIQEGKMMDDFLTDSRRNYNIDFENSLGGSINYTENSKKLFKKL